MKPDPTLLDGVSECLFLLVQNQHPCMPPSTPIQHVKDDVLVDEEEVTLDLFVESIGDIDTEHVIRSWICPHPADLTRVADFWNKVQYFIWDSDSFQESAHDLS